MSLSPLPALPRRIPVKDGDRLFIVGCEQPRQLFGTVAGSARRYNEDAANATNVARLRGHELAWCNAEATVIARYSDAERAELAAIEAARFRVHIGDILETEYGGLTLRFAGPMAHPDRSNVRLDRVANIAPTYVSVKRGEGSPHRALVTGHWFDGERGGTTYVDADTGAPFQSRGVAGEVVEIEQIGDRAIPVELIGGEVVEVPRAQFYYSAASVREATFGWGAEEQEGSAVLLRSRKASRTPDGRWVEVGEVLLDPLDDLDEEQLRTFAKAVREHLWPNGNRDGEWNAGTALGIAGELIDLVQGDPCGAVAGAVEGAK